MSLLPPATPGARRPVPVRTILAAIALVLLSIGTIELVREMARILTWIVVAAFFAVVLNPAVDFVDRRVPGKRGLATFVVFLAGIGLTAALLYAFIRPIVDQTQKFVDNLPEYVEDAKEGRGAIGRLVNRYDIDEYVERNQPRFREALQGAAAPAVKVAQSVANTVVALLTILVLTFLMLLEGPRMLQTLLRAIDPPTRRERLRRVAADCARAITGYVAGNLLISLIAGVATYVFLWIAGVPFREVLALWVAFADLIPLLGATLGAIPTVGLSFIHSVPAGIASVIFYILYQQFENHVLQITIMSRTVDLNPLVVLVSVLMGVELFGILGALLAIPVAGMIQVVARDLYDERKGRMKEEPTIGADEIPMSKTPEPLPD